MFTAKCFQRSGNVTAADGTVWDGGSDFPEDTEQGVTYYRGFLQKDATQEITRQVVLTAACIEC
jgi:hypothetical protein